MDEIFYDVVDLLKALISTPSVSREEQAAADIIENFLKARGCTTQRCGNNVWTIAPGYSHERPTLLLNSHIDTVRPVDGWTRNPFSPDDDGERIYGLGSNDAGASVVSLTAAFLLLSQRQQRYNLVFLASCEEEISGKGGIEAVLPLLPKIDVALVGEPTGMHPAVAEKGLMVLDGEIAGKSGHAARNEGENAIYKALPMIERLRSLSFPLTSAHLGPVKISVTQISAGTQHNVVPDMCRIVVDVRTTDAYTNDMLESLKVALCSQRSQNCLPNVGWCEVTDMLFKNNAKIGARYFPDQLGVLKAGAAADIIVMDYKPFTPFSDENIDGHMIFGMTGRQCQTTIAAGKTLMLDRQLVGIDEEAENAVKKVLANLAEISVELRS